MNALLASPLSTIATTMKFDELSFRHYLALFKWVIEGPKPLLPNVLVNMQVGGFIKADLSENADPLCSSFCQCVSCSAL